jgi:hypothetical protein
MEFATKVYHYDETDFVLVSYRVEPDLVQGQVM